MFLAIFDLDGTLADTLAADHRCFVEAFGLEHGIDFTDDDWRATGDVLAALRRQADGRGTAG